MQSLWTNRTDRLREMQTNGVQNPTKFVNVLYGWTQKSFPALHLDELLSGAYFIFIKVV